MSTLMRSTVAVALALLSALTAVAPHRHANTDGLFSIAAEPSQVTKLSVSSAAVTHSGIHNDREHPCIACVRNLLQGLTSARERTIAPRTPAALLVSRFSFVERSAQVSIVLLRGPPAPMSHC